MSTIKNGQSLLYCHFNKIMKGPGTSFQSPALSQKLVRNICHTAYFVMQLFLIFYAWEKFAVYYDTKGENHT